MMGPHGDFHGAFGGGPHGGFHGEPMGHGPMMGGGPHGFYPHHHHFFYRPYGYGFGLFRILGGVFAGMIGLAILALIFGGLFMF